MTVTQLESFRAVARRRHFARAVPTIAAHFVPAVFKEFKVRFPQVAVLLREERTTPLLTGLLQSGEIDLSIALRPLRSAGLWRCYMRDPDGYLIEVGQYTQLAFDHFKKYAS
jgi:DNA-binding transcriptional LysR family regulator